MNSKSYVWGGVAIIVIIVAAFLVFNKKPDSQENPAVTQNQPLKIGYLPLTDHMPLMVAHRGQLFKGVSVEPVKFTDWPSLVEALKAKKIDGAHMINTLAMKAVLDGYDGRVVVLSHRGDLALVTKPDVTDVQQLKGKTIAVPSRFSTHYLMLHNYLTTNGFDVQKDVTILDVAPPDFVATMAAGKIDGFLGSEPFPTLAESKNVGKTFKLWNEMQIAETNGLDCVVVLNNDLIKNNPTLVQSYVSTIVAAGLEIERNPLEAATHASPDMLNLAPALIVKAIDAPRARSSYDRLVPVRSEFEAMQNYMLKIALIPKGVDLTSFVDDSFAAQAYAALPSYTRLVGSNR